MPTRNVNLTEHFDHFIEMGIASGRFSNASEVVREGLRLLEQREQEDKAKIEWLRAAEAGREQEGENMNASQDQSPSELISQRIADLADWRGETLGRMRKLIQKAAPNVVEEWKWRGTPVWAHDGIICTGETYKKVVKLTFAKGAALQDPARLFNSSLDGNVRRAIDIHEGEKIDEAAFQALIRQAVALNGSGKSKTAKKAKAKAKG